MPNTPLQGSPSVVEDSDEEKILNDLQELFPTSPTQCNKKKGSLRIAASEKGLYVGALSSLKILCTYAFGSKNMSYGSSNLELEVVGVWLSTSQPPHTPCNGIGTHNPWKTILRVTFLRIPMKKRDLNVAKSLLKLVKQNHDYVHELGIMIKTKEKAEIEALSANEVGYLATRYIPSKLRNLDWRNQSGRAVDLEELQEEEDIAPSEITSNIPQELEGFEPPQEEVIPIRRSERTHRSPNRLCLNVKVDEHSLGDLGEPANYKAAMLDPGFKKWVDAMNAKMQSMIDNMVWVLVDLPPNCKTVGSMWIFKKKTDMDGNVHTYKARLVAKGYTQTYMVDYEETFSPMADIKAIRILISIAAFYDYEIWQMDVKTAFLNGYLDEDIYMVQPEGFVDPKHPKKVCKLQRSIYGLKQVSRSWNKRFDEEIKMFGFDQNLDESCVYQKASGSNGKRHLFLESKSIEIDRSD
ncbi:retrotransposon protein, putative, ty1-copia subclass [Tanacetum coccineum]